MAGGRGGARGVDDHRRFGRRAAGVVTAIAALGLLVAVAVVWAGNVARREAVEKALGDVPGLQADEPALAGTTVAVPADAQPVQVVRVVDGDTLVVTAAAPGPVVEAAGEAMIRLLEIDTPEVDGPRTTEQCFGPQASTFTAAMLPEGSSLVLSRDVELTDRFERILAYAWTADGTFVNESILRNGYGYATLLPPNDQYISTMLAAEDAARAERRGVWGTCA